MHICSSRWCSMQNKILFLVLVLMKMIIKCFNITIKIKIKLQLIQITCYCSQNIPVHPKVADRGSLLIGGRPGVVNLLNGKACLWTITTYWYNLFWILACYKSVQDPKYSLDVTVMLHWLPIETLTCWYIYIINVPNNKFVPCYASLITHWNIDLLVHI